MTERLPEGEHFDRRRALAAIVDGYGFTYLEASQIVGCAAQPFERHRIVPGQYRDIGSDEQARRFEAFLDIADSVEPAIPPERFREMWNEVGEQSLAEAGYRIENARHRVVITSFETGEEVSPAKACTDAKTLLERWQDPDGPDVVGIWFKNMNDHARYG